jgi:hypothetical protein
MQGGVLVIWLVCYFPAKLALVITTAIEMALLLEQRLLSCARAYALKVVMCTQSCKGNLFSMRLLCRCAGGCALLLWSAAASSSSWLVLFTL